MALHIEGDRVTRTDDSRGETVVVDRYWCLTEDKARVVPEDHPDGRTLWASPGSEVSKADAIRLGALVETSDEGDVKERTPAENKQRRGATTKAKQQN